MTTRTYDPGTLVALPTLKARETLAVGRALVAVARQEPGLPSNVTAAADGVATTIDPLARELGPTEAAARPGVRDADRVEDNAYGALVDFVRAFARLPPGEFPQSAQAASVLPVLTDEKQGLGFLTFVPLVEWSEVDTRLKALDARGLAEVVTGLGGGVFLDHLRTSHVAYGLATGGTASLPSDDSPAVRSALDAITVALRYYVVQVVASVHPNAPETAERASKLLRPLTEWQRPAATVVTEPPAPDPAPPTG